MQLTGPFFLFLFLPLALLCLLPVKAKYRPAFFALLSLLYLLFAGRNNPLGSCILLSTAVLSYLLLLFNGKSAGFFRVLGMILPLSVFLFCRIAAEYGLFGLSYPYGLSFVTLAVISADIDVKETEKRPSPALYFSYVFFFPLLTAGPFLRFENYKALLEKSKLSVPLFSVGVRRYLRGFIKRIALSAVFLRAFGKLWENSFEAPVFFIPFLLILCALFAFLFFLSGCSDMARGIAAMFGFSILPDNRFFSHEPALLPQGLLLSLSAWLKKYLPPLFSTVWGSPLLVFAIALFFRTRPEILLFALPAALLSLWRSKKGKRLRCVLSFLSLGFLAVGLFLSKPLSFFSFCANCQWSADAYRLFRIWLSVSDTVYLLAVFLATCLFFPLFLRRNKFLLRRNTVKHKLLLITNGVLLLTLFVLTLIFLYPQFPLLSDFPSIKFYL